jgi:outer membrane protein W
MNYKFLIAAFLFIYIISSIPSYPQFNEKRLSIGINGVYTTTAQIYLNPNSSDPIIRNKSFEITDIFNPAIDIRYRITDEIILGLGTEYMKATSGGGNITVISGNLTRNIEIIDGFLLIPIELSGYYILPFSTEKFKFLMGGGGAYYYGKHIREFGNASVSSVSQDVAYGVQVSISMDYMIRNDITIHSEMKFRDPQFKLVSEYDNQEVNYNGTSIFIEQKTFDSKINVDGVTFILGVSFLL